MKYSNCKKTHEIKGLRLTSLRYILVINKYITFITETLAFKRNIHKIWGVLDINRLSLDKLSKP